MGISQQLALCQYHQTGGVGEFLVTTDPSMSQAELTSKLVSLAEFEAIAPNLIADFGFNPDTSDNPFSLAGCAGECDGAKPAKCMATINID